MKVLSIPFLLVILMSNAQAQDVCVTVNGATILAQDNENTYLGKIENEFSSDSIFNEFGTYGSEFSSSSIWNEFSPFGSEFSSYSPFNEFTSTPPMLIKDGQIVGYLSANKNVQSSVTPNLLKALCGE